MMQFSLALLCVLAAAKTMDAFVIPNFGKGELYKDFQEFIDLLPEDDIVGLIMQYAAEDEEFQQAMEYMQGDTFQKLVVEVESIPEVVKLLHYLNDAGVDIYALVNQINGLLGVPSLVPPPAPVFITAEDGKGIAGLIAKIQALIPVKKLEALYNKKMQESKAFQDFIAQLKSPNFQTIVNKVYANPRFQELLAYAKKAGVDVEMIKKLLYNILGITVPSKPQVFQMRKPSSQLAQDLADFFALIPAKQAEDIITSYMAEDQQVQKAVTYLYTKEFQKMMLDVEGLREYQEFVMYLDEAGLDIIKYIQQLHLLLGMEDYVPPHHLLQARKVGDGLKGMCNDLKKIIPVQKVKNMYYDKLHNSKAFREFVDHIKSHSFQKIIDSLYSHPIFLEMITKAKAAGLDLEAVADFLHNVFGLNFPRHRM